MDPVNLKLWEKLRIKRGDNLPFRGWAGTRETLGEVFCELGYKVGAEIGVREGIFSRVLCAAVPGLKLYCIDPWDTYNWKMTQERQDRYLRRARQRLASYDVEFIKKKSLEAVKDFKNDSLDFVYIDGLHDFDNVVMDIVCWSPKVRPGGIVAGHDFKHVYSDGVVFAVEAYTRAHNIQMWYITLDDPPSFVWAR